jgi:translation initiation factor IF-1
MVKNTKGGSGHKSQARKFASVSSSKKTRLSEDEMEIYACVTSLLGGANCSVKGVDGETRLCIIRGKFRGGRGKRGNMLTRGTWVLVGTREWSSESGSDKESRKCDLLEVYNDADKQELRKVRGINWDSIEMPDASSGKVQDSGGFEFSSSAHQSEYEELLKKSAGENMRLQITPISDIPESATDYNDEVDVDDI